MKQTFENYLKQARTDFAKVAAKYTVTEHLELRTAIDSLLIAYNQALSEALNMRKVDITFKEKNEQTFEAFLDINFYKMDIFYQSKKTGYLWTRECILDFYKNNSLISS